MRTPGKPTCIGRMRRLTEDHCTTNYPAILDNVHGVTKEKPTHRFHRRWIMRKKGTPQDFPLFNVNDCGTKSKKTTTNYGAAQPQRRIKPQPTYLLSGRQHLLSSYGT